MLFSYIMHGLKIVEYMTLQFRFAVDVGSFLSDK